MFLSRRNAREGQLNLKLKEVNREGVGSLATISYDLLDENGKDMDCLIIASKDDAKFVIGETSGPISFSLDIMDAVLFQMR